MRPEGSVRALHPKAPGGRASDLVDMLKINGKDSRELLESDKIVAVNSFVTLHLPSSKHPGNAPGQIDGEMGLLCLSFSGCLDAAAAVLRYTAKAVLSCSSCL